MVGVLAAVNVALQLSVIRGGSYHTDRRFLTYQNFHQVGSLDRDMADSKMKFLFRCKRLTRGTMDDATH